MVGRADVDSVAFAVTGDDGANDGFLTCWDVLFQTTRPHLARDQLRLGRAQESARSEGSEPTLCWTRRTYPFSLALDPHLLARLVAPDDTRSSGYEEAGVLTTGGSRGSRSGRSRGGLKGSWAELGDGGRLG
jgi:hypothetical protein